jgi:hypothetical protein
MPYYRVHVANHIPDFRKDDRTIIRFLEKAHEEGACCHAIDEGEGEGEGEGELDMATEMDVARTESAEFGLVTAPKAAPKGAPEAEPALEPAPEPVPEPATEAAPKTTVVAGDPAPDSKPQRGPSCHRP